MQALHKQWNAAEDQAVAFMPERDVDAVRRSEREQGKPQFTTLVIPYSYSILMSAHTYYTSVLLSRNPVFQFSPRHSETPMNVQAIEAIIDYQVIVGRHMVPYYIWLMDVGKYGLGVLGNYWEEEERRVTKIVEEDEMVGFGAFKLATGKKVKKRVTERAKGYHGNRVYNVRPTEFFPDPRVPLSRFQEGEFVGRLTSLGWNDILRRESLGYYMNIEDLKKSGDSREAYTPSSNASEEVERDALLEHENELADVNQRHFVEMSVDLVPEYWGLGDSDLPEKWFFTCTQDFGILVQASPQGTYHNRFPFEIIELEIEGYALANRGILEITQSLQETMDWLFNCYDAETEILTSQGWVRFDKLSDDCSVATVSKDLNNYWFETPEQIVRKEYAGKMLKIQHRSVDLLVTPNHWMYTKKRGHESYSFTRAALLPLAECLLPVTSKYQGGEEAPPIFFAGVKPLRGRGRTQRYQDVLVEWSWLAPFIGLYVSEGSATHGKSSGSYMVRLTQKKLSVEIFDMLMQRCPFKYTRSVRKDGTVDWYISDRRFYFFMVEICGKGSHNKCLPRIIFDMPLDLRQAVFDCAMIGDGYYSREDYGVYGSESKQLLDDMQELALSLGYHAKIKDNVLRFSTTRKEVTVQPRMVTDVDYSGKVYCVTNSTHLVIVRRKGKVVIAGQTHFYNIRKALNDQFIIDPSKVNMSDVLDPLPGGLWRLRPEAYGTDVNTVATQMRVTDVTQVHLQDTQIVGSLLQRISGVSDNSQGIVNQGGRKTATEIRSANTSSSSRLKTQTEFFSVMGFLPLAQVLVQNTQQFMEDTIKLRAAGDLLGYNDRLDVSPENIAGFYDYVPVDGTLPIDRFAQVNLWRTMLADMRQDQKLMMSYDTNKIWGWVAQLGGMKDINRFKIQVMPDNQLQAQAQAGNLVDLRGATSGKPRPANVTSRAPGNILEPGQIEGMGATG